ncbi:hypothetical protein AVEN_211493-1 [Araneus ventricosus]|uniref:Uncharacterized protein n=1 Tax=Araneus ventricosus TaxID=182803 RepID=A0A4Y2UQS4_ARAVE|nr:hypothetical protein AVEN_211493-1 [Araneus ventricosus]
MPGEYAALRRSTVEVDCDRSLIIFECYANNKQVMERNQELSICDRVITIESACKATYRNSHSRQHYCQGPRSRNPLEEVQPALTQSSG